ncbi:hypothetical protein EJ06DRAFT_527955 [Trichodelitschia bisporula]|uniref:Uncharacterized protein n=1 Tax=Trichodelitschia bisporula TaxID=703511 RepID=A0A6G1I3W8_9PEZI|nr:hypothetical protein EJ06DRAFT_527955 [Trichodelitschia bisporula]
MRASILPHLASRTFARTYAHRTPVNPPLYRLKLAVVSGYLIGAFTLPFVPPYLASKRSRQDGTWATRPPLKFSYCPRC